MQRESKRAVLILVIIVAAIVAFVTWLAYYDTGRPNTVSRYGSTAVVLLALVLLVRIELAKDKVPDLLRQQFGKYLERNGLCFTLTMAANDGVCWLEVYFQNRYDRPCSARMRIKPRHKLLGNKVKIDPLDFRFDCGPAAFGVAHVPIGVPAELQGTLKQTFELGADVTYPKGRGKVLRMRDGMRVGQTRFYSNRWIELLAAVCTLGMVGLSKAASTTVALPEEVAEELPPDLEVTTETIWQLGDPLPEEGTPLVSQDQADSSVR